METPKERLERLIKCELNTVKTLKKQKKSLEKMIKHAQNNAVKLNRKLNKL